MSTFDKIVAVAPVNPNITSLFNRVIKDIDRDIVHRTSSATRLRTAQLCDIALSKDIVNHEKLM